jgi:hypothetical protein
VPAISRFSGIVIAMFFDDHDPPHSHARHAAGEARIRIDTLEVMDSTLGRRQQRLVVALGRAPSARADRELKPSSWG